jgi:TolB-like protein/tetratricopeptide (TPR) repeat protein
MQLLSAARWSIGEFVIDARIDEILHGEVATKIERRAMQVLQHLAARQGQVVGVEDLLGTVWAGTVVTPDSVYRTIAALRRVFDTDPARTAYIVTVPRRGYRLVAPVAPMPDRSDDRLQGDSEIAARAEPSIASIAVLPFVDLSEKGDQEYLSDGLAEELIHLLVQVPELRIPARRSSFYFKGKSAGISEIAARLNVAHVLEGSVRTAGDQIRVTAQLVRAETGYHVWSATYDRSLGDVFAIQDEISSSVVSALSDRLMLPTRAAGARPMPNPAAYEQCLLGRRLFLRGHADDFRRGVVAYRTAIELDPTYAVAYAGLAMAEAYLADSEGDPSGREHALRMADQAVSIGSAMVEGYAARGTLRLVFCWDWHGAKQDLEKALAIEPNDSWAQRQYGKLMRSLGLLPDALEFGIKATLRDPLSNYVWEGIGNTYAAAGRLDAARDAYRQALNLQPESFYAADGLGVVELLAGNAREALRLFGATGMPHSFALPATAMAQYSLGRRSAAARALAEAAVRQAHTGAYDIAAAYAWMGDREEAIAWLQRAHANRERGLSEMMVDPLLAGLRGDQRYEGIKRAIGLVAPT